MKHLYKFLSVVALAAVLFAGCNKEQSSLSVSDIPGSATIMGSYYYNAGQDWNDGEYYQEIKPLANHVVYAQVLNNDLKAGSEGYTVYETMTDANGKFTVQVPATLEGVTVEVYPKPFIGTYQEVTGIEDGEPVLEEKEVVYQREKETRVICSNDIKFVDLLCTHEGHNDIESYPYVAQFRVNVKEGVTKKERNEDDVYVVKYTSESASGVDVIATIDGKKYVAATAGNGSAVFVIPAKKTSWSTSANIEVKPYAKTVQHYYSTIIDDETKIKSIDLKGCYRMFNGYNYITSLNDQTVNFYDLEGKPMDSVNVKMVFEPYEKAEEFNKNNWSDDKAWEW